MKHRIPRHAVFFGALAIALTVALILPSLLVAAAPEAAAVHRGPGGLTFEPQVVHDGGTLTVTGPAGWSHIQAFAAGETLEFPISRELEDGLYRFEVRLAPQVDAATRRALLAAREEGGTAAREALDRFRTEGKLPAGPLVTFGTFTVEGGTLLGDPGAVEVSEPTEGTSTTGEEAAVFGRQTASSSGIENLTAADQVIIDDLIVTERICAGNYCVNGESFGVETLRLKETSTGIAFVDTSGGSFASNDWQLTVNETGSGGANKFSIDDVTGSRTPFTIEAGARTHSLYVDDRGRVGFGTGAPVLEAHFVDGDTPTLRLQQDGSSSFTPQIWDIGGNEANFFVRDATNASQIPFSIKPSAPTNSLFVAASGDLGVGTGAPQAGLHVVRSGTEAVRDLLQLTNNGRVRWRLQDTSPDGQILTVRLAEGNLDFSFSGTTGDQMELTSSGDLEIQGILREMSDRDRKTEIVPVEPKEILEGVLQLPIAHWKRKDGDPEVRHLGPMAQDFHALFGLGADDRHIATLDTSGVALAAIQALGAQLEEKQDRIEDLEARLAALEARLAP